MSFAASSTVSRLRQCVTKLADAVTKLADGKTKEAKQQAAKAKECAKPKKNTAVRDRGNTQVVESDAPSAYLDDRWGTEPKSATEVPLITFGSTRSTKSMSNSKSKSKSKNEDTYDPFAMPPAGRFDEDMGDFEQSNERITTGSGGAVRRAKKTTKKSAAAKKSSAKKKSSGKKR
jgi:hypothetical protein